MQEIVVVSGKGGAGKTTVTALLAKILPTKVICDCDVEGANLHLLLKPEVKERSFLKLGRIARVEEERCVGCGKCVEHCRFFAMEVGKERKARVIEGKCEGCGVCDLVCPVGAVEMIEEETGWIYRGKSECGELFYGDLFPGKGNSGKLVSHLKSLSRSYAMGLGIDLLLVDGPPGIGCPVISALSGADVVVLVQEATPSGRSDVERVLELLDRFPSVKRKIGIINKWGVDEDADREAEELFEKWGVPIAWRIRFDERIYVMHSLGHLFVPPGLDVGGILACLLPSG